MVRSWTTDPGPGIARYRCGLKIGAHHGGRQLLLLETALLKPATPTTPADALKKADYLGWRFKARNRLFEAFWL